MVCAVLEIVREFFSKGQARLKMRFFLSYFHRYYYTKKDAWDQEALEQLSNPEATENGVMPDVQTRYVASNMNRELNNYFFSVSHTK